MSSDLESDTLRRQANTVVRLTVVTVFGLIGSVVTGVAGMNLFAFADYPLVLPLVSLIAVAAAVTVLPFYKLAKSKGLADFLDSVSDERLPVRAWASLLDVWRRRPKVRPGNVPRILGARSQHASRNTEWRFGRPGFRCRALRPIREADDRPREHDRAGGEERRLGSKASYYFAHAYSSSMLLTVLAATSLHSSGVSLLDKTAPPAIESGK